ncbi:hypothetical protein ONZ45_g9006 [Pleurotus djamor]|nr:hypothetical protein ONZ45_g9006 [Pleurotus djamor]
MSKTLCRYVVQGGPNACRDVNCRFNHNVPVCEPCAVTFASKSLLDAHLSSKRHLSKIRGVSNETLLCPLCNRYMSQTSWEQHVNGGPHRTQMQRYNRTTPVEPEIADEVPGHILCTVCSRHILTRFWARHEQSQAHKSKARYLSYRTTMDEAERDKNGIVVTGDAKFGVVLPETARNGITRTLTIENKDHYAHISILSLRLASRLSSFAVHLQGATSTLLPHKSVNLQVTFRQQDYGRYSERLDITFEDVKLRTRFCISRPLSAIVGNHADHELLAPKAPFVPRQRQAREPEITVVPPVLPPSTKAVPYVVDLPYARIPLRFSSLFRSGPYNHVLNAIKQTFLPRNLNADSYGLHFKYLLWTEEVQSERDMEIYDMKNVTLLRNQSGLHYFLKVPGLAEKRPSVLIGDIILVQECGSPKGHWYSGGVHVVNRDQVGLGLDRSFRWRAGQLYNVRFKLNRYPLRRQHQGMESPFSPARVLFPVEGHALPWVKIPTLTFNNQLIASNPAQKQAVDSIVSQPPGSIPFVIFGPPGTGKTVTLVEAIQGVLATQRNARILACAPSNSAADLIAERLTSAGRASLKPNELFRFYAPSRSKDTIPDSLNRYIYTLASGHLSVPILTTMKAFRVVVATCVSSSFAHGIGMPRGHFTHIFVDEASQATEPEVMVPIKTMADTKTNIVLSGDPKQLGPIVRSKFARDLGLDTSFIERLMERSLYDYRAFHGVSIVKLVKNFRSHSTILKFPNEHFYANELQPCADPKIINAYIGSKFLPNPKFPIIFHAIAGKDDREASSPSFFNIDEASQVRNYISMLRDDRRVRLSDNDIGVITPYHAQVMRIRTLLRPVADGVKVASVEEFQGQERKVMIVSTVRSSREFVEYDLRHTLGFVANPRRFNVTVTRAQALLIIVGDPAVLSLDPLWRSFLNYIHTNGGWKGPDPNWNTGDPVRSAGGFDKQMKQKGFDDMNEFTEMIEALTLHAASAEPEDEQTEQAEANVDRPWADQE